MTRKYSRHTLLFLVPGWIILLIGQAFAQGSDAHTLLRLGFNNSLNGEAGETPTTATGTAFVTGVSGQGLSLPANNQLFYPSANNINATEGTVECWIKPDWNGNDGQHHWLLQFGVGGGLLIGKDSANNLRILLNRLGAAPGGETGAGIGISNWQANQWHHIAFSWSNSAKAVKLYIDGILVAQTAFTLTLPVISSTSFQIGGDGSSGYLNAAIDELRISDTVRTPQEIASNMAASLTISLAALTPATTSIELSPGWSYWKDLKFSAITNIGAITLPASVAIWSSSNPAVAKQDAVTGRIKAVGAGTASVIATLGSTQASVTVNVLAPKIQMVEETIDPYLATPASGYLYKMPVAIIRYFPTKDGINIDTSVTNWTQSLVDLKARQLGTERNHKFMLEEGSRFRGYKDAMALPTLGYQVVKIYTVYEEIPPGFPEGLETYFPDFNQIMERFDAKNLVENQGVKEFWIAYYHFGRIVPVESNMSSALTGDISNSFRFQNDLPIFNRSYLVYGINFGGAETQATHNHGHQIESIMGFSNNKQDGNDNLFWRNFSGRNAAGSFANNGRAGNTHYPPNAIEDYDYMNPNPISSDIEDWNPAGTGTKKQVSSATWGGLFYNWPGGQNINGKTEAQWYIYWMQNMPGRGNVIPYNTNRMTNWWHFTGDWDAANKAGIGLYEPAACDFTLSSAAYTAPLTGGDTNITVACPGGCKWFASSNESWIKINSGAIGAGNGTLSLTIAPSTNGGRIGTVAIAGKAFTISQPGVATSVSGANYLAAIAREAIVSVFGQGLATATLAASSNPLPTTLAGTTIKVKDSTGTERLAPLFYVSTSQINFQIPIGTASGNATITVTNSAGGVSLGSITVADIAPGIFSASADGVGLAAAQALRVKLGNVQTYEEIARYDSTLSKFVAIPINLDTTTDSVYLLLYGTGIRFRSSLANVRVTIGGQVCQLDYAGAQGFYIGLDQLNILLPQSLRGRGDADVVITVDGKVANTVKVNIK
jgi:uncharacterized protein (TIGR03437 family)